MKSEAWPLRGKKPPARPPSPPCDFARKRRMGERPCPAPLPGPCAPFPLPPAPCPARLQSRAPANHRPGRLKGAFDDVTRERKGPEQGEGPGRGPGSCPRWWCNCRDGRGHLRNWRQIPPEGGVGSGSEPERARLKPWPHEPPAALSAHLKLGPSVQYGSARFSGNALLSLVFTWRQAQTARYAQSWPTGMANSRSPMR